MKIGDKVRVRKNPVSVLKSYAGMTAEIISSGLGEYLIRLENRELWWVKWSDIEVIGDD
jgi:hypothetical protein